MNPEALYAFMTERHRIYLNREAGRSWPWTEDPILRAYRFCNVFRNLDKETKLIHDNWLKPHKEDRQLWFACVVARLVNWWPTLEEVEYPVPWSSERFVKVLDSRKHRGLKVFTGAYMVRADAVVEGTKAAYLAQYVLGPLWNARERVLPGVDDTLESFHQRLMGFRDMGSFMAAQVVADAKYFDTNLINATDWARWAAPGPGSLRGLNRVCGRKVRQAWTLADWRTQFDELFTHTRKHAPERFLAITGQDLQNCLCEFDKYERVRLNEGKPRARYQPPVPTLTDQLKEPT